MTHPKAKKLDRLADVLDLETGEVLPDAFAWERRLYDEAVWVKHKAARTEAYRLGATLNLPSVVSRGVALDKTIQMRRLNRQMRACRLCPGLNQAGVTEVCVPWGDYDAKIAVIGQSAHKYAVRSDLPFILQSGLYLDAACYLSGIRRDQLLIHNVVACHPENNRASKDEWKDNCRRFLAETLRIVGPELVVCLGNDAAYVVERIWDGKRYNAVHPAAFLHGSYGSDVVLDWCVKLSDQMDKVLGNSNV